MYGLTLEWEHCPDGVGLLDGPGGKVFRCRSSRRFPIRLEIDDLENPLILEFINAEDDDALAQFFSEFGFLDKWQVESMNTECLRKDVLSDQRAKRKLLTMAGSEQPNAVAINKKLINELPRGLLPVLDGTRLSLNLVSLHQLMIMEAVMVVEKEARLTSCENCGLVFLTGPTTGRRSHAKFCSDRCRVAASRARQAS